MISVDLKPGDIVMKFNNNNRYLFIRSNAQYNKKITDVKNTGIFYGFKQKQTLILISELDYWTKQNWIII